MTAPAPKEAATPPDLLAALVAADATRPRLTWYDDADGETRGERIELSGRVLANWVAKAANLLTDELGIERGDVVALDLPVHWRAVYWALAAWRVGAVVSVDGGSAGAATAAAVVTADPAGAAASAGGQVVAISLPALARRWSGGANGTLALPTGAVDEAADLSSQPDVFEPVDPPDADDAALRVPGRAVTAGQLVAEARSVAAKGDWSAGSRVAVAPTSGDALGQALFGVLAAWTVDGSAVLVREPDPALVASRWSAERVTSAFDPPGTPASRP
jgi:uncharacterized protein (TIGR03089 family)